MLDALFNLSSTQDILQDNGPGSGPCSAEVSQMPTPSAQMCYRAPAGCSRAYRHAAIHKDGSSLSGLAMHATTLCLNECIDRCRETLRWRLAVPICHQTLQCTSQDTFKAMKAFFCDKVIAMYLLSCPEHAGPMCRQSRAWQMPHGMSVPCMEPCQWQALSCGCQTAESLLPRG